LDPAALADWLASRGEPTYRARQIADALWRNHARTPDELRTLPAELRDAVDQSFRLDTIVETTTRPADAGLTEKALHRLADGPLVESVLMHYPARPGRRERHTLCISSQVGCAVGCPFSPTGALGFGTDPELADILGQPPR